MTNGLMTLFCNYETLAEILAVFAEMNLLFKNQVDLVIYLYLYLQMAS